MGLPGDLTTVLITGTFKDAGGVPLLGSVTFTPSAMLTDATGLTVVWDVPKCFPLTYGTLTTGPLAATDNADISPSGWTYTVTVAIQGAPLVTFSCLLPSSPPEVDFSALAVVTAQPPVSPAAYLPVSGGTMTGPLILLGGLKIPAGAAAGDSLVSDGSGNATWGGHFSQTLTGESVVTVTHGLGRYPAVTVIDTSDDVCYADVRYVDDDNVQLTFSAPFSGTAICT